jgi:hypothetical protein
MKKFDYLKNYSSDMVECLHRSGTVTDNLPTNFGGGISIKVDILSHNTLILPFRILTILKILTIRRRQNSCANRVSDQSVQKQRKISPIRSCLLLSPIKNYACYRSTVACSLPNFIEKCWNTEIYGEKSWSRTFRLNFPKSVTTSWVRTFRPSPDTCFPGHVTRP